MRLPRAALSLLVLLPLAACGVGTGTSDGDGPVVRVYSARTYGAEKAYAQFTKDTGIEVDFLNGSDAELRERLAEEGADTKADVFLTVDVANLALAAEQGLFQPDEDPETLAAVPAELRDPQDRWVALALRARAIVYNKDTVKPSDLSTYDALGDPRWKGRACLRTSTSAYTQSLVSSMIANEGREEAAAAVKGWVDNDAQILANDVEILKTVSAGGCDVGITNHYYLAREQAKDPSLSNVGLFWPNQGTTGTHINISGAGITKHAQHPDLARTFIRYLATTGQSVLVDANFEFPVNPGATPVPAIVAFGPFKRDDLNLGQLGNGNAEAVEVLTAAGYR